MQLDVQGTQQVAASPGLPALERPPDLLVLEHVTKRFPGVVALREIDLRLAPGEVLGLVGENGAGKSTLLSLIAGIHQPDEGQLRFHGRPVRVRSPLHANRLGVSIVFQEQGLVLNMRVYENLFLAREDRFATVGILRQRQMGAEAQRILESLGIDLDPMRPVSSLSFAERQLLEIAKAFLPGLEESMVPIILLDEPTSALSDREIDLLFTNLRTWKERASFIYVSHRLSEVLEVCDRLYVLKDGCQVGEYPVGSVGEERLHALMVGRARDAVYYQEHRQVAPQDQPLLEVKRLGRRHAFTDISFCVHRGEVLGIGGMLGSGKSDLGKALAGILPPDEGAIHLDNEVIRPRSVRQMSDRGVAYLPQERKVEGIIPYLPVAWNMTLPIVDTLTRNPLGAFVSHREDSIVNDYIQRLRIKTPSTRTLAVHLSGGNQQKVVLAKWLAKKARVLVLDDPTRGLDVGARAEVYGLLRDLTAQGVGIILLSDNLPELIGLSTRVILMKDGQIMAEIPCPPNAKPAEHELVRHIV